MKMVPLGEIAEIVSGGTPKTSVSDYWGGEIPWVTPADLRAYEDAYFDSPARSITPLGLKSCGATMLPPGSILMSSRAPIGYTAITTVPMASNQGFKSIVPGPHLDTKFIYHWIRAHGQLLNSLGNGATFKEISKRVVSEIHIPCPPVDEQRRVATILDKADAIRRKRRQAASHVEELAQAVFFNSFADHESWKSIGELAESTQYGSSAKAGASGTWPILRMGNITYGGSLDLTDLKYLDLKESDIPKYTVQRGDLLFNRTNSADLVGKTCVVDTDDSLAFAGYLIRVRFPRPETALVTGSYLNSPRGKAVLRNMAKSIIGQANINAKELRSIQVPSATLDQEALHSARMTKIKKIADHLAGKTAESDRLFASLQSRAFRGEL